MNLFARIVENLYRRGCRSKANHHRLVTVFSLRCEEVPTEALLDAAFDAFRPGDDEQPAKLARWWADGRLRIERLQLWAGGERDETGVYTWRAPTAKTLVHHYDLTTPFGHVRFAAAVERATDPKAGNASLLDSVVLMGDPRDPALYGFGGTVPDRAKDLVTDVEGQQSWRFSVVGNRVCAEHVSEGRRLAKDAALFAILGGGASWLFRLIHDIEMRRGLSTLPDYLSGMGRYAQEIPDSRSTALHGRKIRLQIEQPRWPKWLDRLAL
ncbi:MAG: hypothetical protein U9Q81_15495 [Pseudomonadota bacterium]|nr:hypothetical protein [Pseudomonadota bacterium]